MQIAELLSSLCLFFTTLDPESLALVVCVPDSSAVLVPWLQQMEGPGKCKKEREQNWHIGILFARITVHTSSPGIATSAPFGGPVTGSPTPTGLGYKSSMLWIFGLRAVKSLFCHCLSIPNGTSKSWPYPRKIDRLSCDPPEMSSVSW